MRVFGLLFLLAFCHGCGMVTIHDKRSPSSIDQLKKDSSCSNLFREFFIKVKSVSGPTDLNNKVLAILKKEGLTHEDKAKEIYFMWIETIAKTLPLDIRADWLAMLPVNPSVSDLKTNIARVQYGYRFMDLDDDPYVVGPFVRSDERAYFDLAVYLHEAIHALESTYLRKNRLRDDIADESTFSMIKMYYYSERAAMISEWRFLSSIPQEIRLKAVELLKEHREANDVYYDMAIRFLENASLPLDEYLKREDQSDRGYSLRDIAEKVKAIK